MANNKLTCIRVAAIDDVMTDLCMMIDSKKKEKCSYIFATTTPNDLYRVSQGIHEITRWELEKRLSISSVAPNCSIDFTNNCIKLYGT